jgi:hypothetical protein
LPIFRSNKAPDTARSAEGLPESGSSGGAPPDVERHDDQTGNPGTARRHTAEQRQRIKSKRQELRRKRQELRKIRNEALAANAAHDLATKIEHKKRKGRKQQEIFQLERELRAAEEGRTEVEQEQTGTLPDFVIIGAQKGGTTFLYDLLSQHPLVEPAAKKELHFFDHRFDFGVEWYSRCFPRPRWEGGRRTITGEASPYYLFHPHAARRAAEVVPEARLIALLRNPVERAYSHHQQLVRKGGEPLGFEEAIVAEEARLRDERDRMLEDEHYASFEHQRLSYLSRGIYVDQLLRWSEFFDREQMLVLKAEDFFKNPRDTLMLVLEFLGLPGWEPAAEELEGAKRNEGGYEREMDPATRKRLEEYFEPHNNRLYDFLGTDFGW